MAITSASGPDAAPRKHALAQNYVDFTSSATEGWAQQYLPDLMEKEAEIYGKRTIAGFLAQVGAEEASAADRVVWSEQGRADAVKSQVAKDKNINTEPRKTHGQVDVGGVKYRVLGESSSDIKNRSFKIRKKK